MKIIQKTNLLVIVSVIAGLAVGSIFLVEQTQAKHSVSNYDDGILKAVIIDQLHRDIPSKYFQDRATEYLVNAGYEVDLFTTEDIDVEFYKKLPSLGYDFIVIRSHALDGRTENDSPKLYTGEKYTTDKYINEQLFGVIDGAYLNPRTDIHAVIDVSGLQETNQIVISLRNSSEVIDWGARVTTDDYFVIGAKAVEEMMVGQFPGSIIILGGCDTLSKPYLAEAFIEKGASEVIGWDGTIDNYNNDIVMLEILKQKLVNKMDLDKAVDLAMEKYFPISEESITLQYYSEKTDLEI